MVKKSLNQDVSSSSSSSSKGKSTVTGTNNKKITHPNRKSEVKVETTSGSSKTISTTTTVKMKSQRKVYALPGQKHDPPEEREPLRIFYESLYDQIPSSGMAEFWMMEHGLLSSEQAKKAQERKQRGKQKVRTGTPINSPSLASHADSSQKLKDLKNGDAKGKKIIISMSDDDFVVKRKKDKG